jgi:hypothetical protein
MTAFLHFRWSFDLMVASSAMYEKWLPMWDSKQNGEKSQVLRSLLSGNAWG